MQMKELITDPAQICTDLQATDRWQAIDELVCSLVSSGRIPETQAADVLAAVRAREETMSTGIGNGIGIPHAAIGGLAGAQAMLGISRHDIEFEALDAKPVRLVILFVVPGDAFQQHLDTLADIARVLSDAETRERICVASTAPEVLDIIRGRSGI